MHGRVPPISTPQLGPYAVEHETKLTVLVQPESNGGYSVSVPAMPGCHSQGETLLESLANIREAADLWAEVVAERLS